ncbi:MAG: long-chain fatty acid--CoA ligase [Mycobacterium sp.]|nr:long-chain fatty acid--CoA ligase [Mycobacterium sp.]
MLVARVAATPGREAFRYPRGDRWESVTWQQVDDRVRTIAAGLISLGVAPGERVALISSTRYEWVIVDYGVLCARAATTTVYPTTIAADVAFIVGNSGSRVVVAEDQSQVDKLVERRADIPDVINVVVIDGEGDGDWVITLEELERRGKELLDKSPGAVDERIEAGRADDLAAIIYTSGTTGNPKGVQLTNVAGTYIPSAVDTLDSVYPDDLNYVWLPLSHSFGKVMTSMPLVVGFPSVIDGRVPKLAENLGILRPTFLCAVPRVLEKVKAGVQGAIAEMTGVKKVMADWAIGVGLQVARARQAGKRPSPVLQVQHQLADRLVLFGIREKLGGRLRFVMTASAPLDRDVALWFDAIGIPVVEGYGLTETSAASLLNRLDAYRFGTVGVPLPGTEVRIAEDGEVLLRGPGVMIGYHEMPEATAEVLEPDGWFHTGDIGELDPDGYLRITDRKKDLFKTSQGKYVAPSAIAAAFGGICPYVAEFVVYGEARPYAVALVALDPDAIKAWAAKQGLGDKSFAEIARDPQTRELVGGYIDQLNAQLNRWEQIKKFTIIDRELSIAAGDLTPSMKLRRKAVVTNFAEQLEDLYDK